MVKALYPGSFDPVHNGHVDIVERASKLVDELIVGVYDTPSKDLMFTTEERVDLFRESVTHLPNVRVQTFVGLAPNVARELGAEFILRGLRAGFDFELEFEMALMWRNVAPDIDVVCMMSSLAYQFVYSSRIKEVAKLGANVDNLVPAHVAAALKEKL
ncbi:MAG: pantetheine-phosphate adenylyltransferase [Chloroflexi bacterium]|nr:pantetheine-phosphate adenylyltransferase [Chloroflexota bacterium]MCH8870170.1 pantetheine-phosphate adenylyltransferase [Chloroflexota bacterium]MCH9037895.1 pantetheine-phosphate adenylyltransferase [Chloroflexota bacterium]MCI0791175.1 pantetheine-phosphate adenylyltransferase [Chloroflexota bacterium]MCI0796403.1 pantetheine-phosphate adenylyltransferase [Chloroflexota bacterium]